MMDENKPIPSAPATPPQPPTGSVPPPPTPQPARNKKPLIVGLLLTAILLVAGSTAAYVAGWLPFWQPLTADAVIDRMVANVLEMRSTGYTLEVGFSSEPREADAVPLEITIPEGDSSHAVLQRDQTRLLEMFRIQTAIEDYQAIHGSTPTSLTQLFQESPALQESIATFSEGEPYGYRQEAGGTDFILHIPLETDTAVETYTGFVTKARGTPVIRADQTIEITKDTPAVYAVVVPPSGGATVLGRLTSEEAFASLPVEIDATFSLQGQSGTEVAASNDAAYVASGQVALGDSTVSVGGELRKKGTDYYFKINDAPSLEFFDLTALKQKWIEVSATDANGIARNLLQGAEVESREISQAQLLAQYQRIMQLLQEEDILQVVQEFPKVTEGEQELFHYQVRIDQAELVTFYRRAAEELEAEFGGQALIKLDEETLQYLESPEFAATYEGLEQNASWELWIDDSTFLPHRLQHTNRLVPPDSVTKLKDIQYRSTFTVEFMNINEPVVVEVPAPTISLEEAQELLFGQPVVLPPHGASLEPPLPPSLPTEAATPQLPLTP